MISTRWLRRVIYWLRFGSRQNDLREELALHRDLLATDFRRRGLSPTDARDAATRAMGNETYMREEARGVWVWPTVDAIVKDWTYAWRGLRRSPAFALVAIVSLALGIGANTAIFGLIHTILLARLPVRAPTELVQLQRNVGAKGNDERFSTDEFEALRSGSIPLTMFLTSGTSIDLGGVTFDASLEAVDGGYFDLLGIRPERGRLLSRRDGAEAAPVAGRDASI